MNAQLLATIKPTAQTHRDEQFLLHRTPEGQEFGMCTEHLPTCSISSEGAGCSEKPGCFQRAFVGPEGIHPPGCFALTQLALPSPANISLFSPISTPAGRFHPGEAPPDHRERASGASCRGETPRALESFPPYLAESEFLTLKANHQEIPQYTSSHRKCRGFSKVPGSLCWFGAASCILSVWPLDTDFP